MRIEPPWHDLDPDTVDVVRMLWLSGFNPTDSGDGVSKQHTQPDALPYPHVFCATEPRDMVDDAENAAHLLNNSWPGWVVEASYSTKGQTA